MVYGSHHGLLPFNGKNAKIGQINNVYACALLVTVVAFDSFGITDIKI